MIHFQSESPRILYSSSIILGITKFHHCRVVVTICNLWKYCTDVSTPWGLEDEDGNIFDRLNNEDVYDEENE